MSDQYHIITTNHPYMIDLGLGAFTTGQLYEWLTKRNIDGTFPNLYGINEPYFDVISEEEIKSKVINEAINIGAYVILGGFGGDFYQDPITLNDLTFSYYRIKDNIVKLNEKQPISNWECSDPNLKMFLESSDLKSWFNLFNDKESYCVPAYGSFSYDQPSIKDRKNLDLIISNIIEINNFANIANEINASGDFWKDKGIFPAIEFIRDFKTSIEKSIEWSGLVPFKINEDCIKPELVKYKMYLYDSVSPKVESNGVAISAPIAISSFTLNGEPGKNENGEYIGDNTKKVGGLDIYQDPITGKFSAKPLVPGYLTTAVAASQNPTIEDIENLDLKTLRELTTMPTGRAIFIEMQNGNPLDWQPNYKLEQSCRKDDTAKAEVNVINPWGQEFSRGEKVLLNHAADNWWIINKVPNNPVSESKFVGYWDFSYFMTNHEFYFAREGTTSDGQSKSLIKFSHDQYEEEFRINYYSRDDYSFAKELNIGTSSTSTFNIPKFGYAHITSWDFMRKEMGGTRPVQVGSYEGKNALKYTVVGKLINGGDQDKRDSEYNYAYDTAPFFGCVFPNGYESSLVREAYEYTQPTGNKLKVQINGITTNINSLNLNYLTQIQDAKEIFKDVNANKTNGVGAGIVEGVDIGIFNQASNGNLLHLPADIAMNSPCSYLKNEPYRGSPITNYNLIFKYMTPEIGTGQYILPEEFFNHKSAYSFYYKNNDISDSFFEFEPVDNKIQFRPLRAETYASLDACNLGVKLAGDAGGLNRGIFGSRSYINTINDRQWTPLSPNATSVPNKLDFQEPLFSRDAIRRSSLLDVHPLEVIRDYRMAQTAGVETIIHNYLVEIGLGYGYNDANVLSQTELGLGRKNTSQYFNSAVKGYFPTGVWDEVYANKPAGAIGVIGASVKYRISGDNIVFNVENCFGTRDKSKALGSPAGVNLSQIIGGMFGVIPSYEGGLPASPSEDVPQWGSDDNYNSFNTTALWVRVFHSWPKHLTIYDPRYFAVHHFNDGIDIINDESQDSTVDLKWPTDEYDKFLFITDKIYSNGASNIGVGPIRKIKSSNDWKVQSGTGWLNGRHRRGKLLPYKYKKFSIGIGTDDPTDTSTAINSEIIKMGDFDINQDKKVKQVNFGVLVKNYGKDYVDGQILTTAGGSGQGVELEVSVGAGGEISNLKVINPGKNFASSAFMNNEDLIKNAKSLVQIVKKNSLDPGEGFDASIVFGRIVASDEEDEKPKEATKIARLTPSSAGNGDDNGIVKRDETIQVLIENKNKTNEYDIFYHYHNDISHVIGYDGDANMFSFDQFVNVEITS
jgi:hypothetical protein